MAKLIQLSNTSWKQPFNNRKKELPLWGTHNKVAAFCNFKDGTKRMLNIRFEPKFNIDYTGLFQITSNNQISFPKWFQDKIGDIIFKNPTSFFIVSVLDSTKTENLENEYNSEDIRWIKNIKREKGSGWAYEGESFEKTFLLNWPNSKRGNAISPQMGEIIALFQKPNEINGRKNKDVHLTHLVSPVSKEIIEDSNTSTHKWCREVELIAKAEPINAIPAPKDLKFSKVGRGLAYSINHLRNDSALTEKELQEKLWSLFKGNLNENLEKLTVKSVLDSNGEILEGDTIIKKHIQFEVKRRNSLIVNQKKEEAIAAGNGRIRCECCGFDFLNKYGEHGKHFIECHHKIFISTGKRHSKPEDLALVCANCHRMLHRKNKKNEYFSVEELRKLINSFTK